MRAFFEAAGARWHDDAREWGLSQASVRLLVIAPFVLAGLGAMAFPFRSLYGLLANEDGVVEWSQVALLVTLVVVYAHLAVLLWRADRRWLAALYGVAALASLFIAGEEISWGQRVLGFATPEGLDAINDQGETNIHNIGLVVKVFNLVVVTICATAITLPILRWTGWRATARSVAGYMLIPPLALIPAFAFPFIHRVVRLALLPDVGARATKYAEFAELSFYVGLVVFAFLARRALLRAHEADRTGGAGDRDGAMPADPQVHADLITGSS